MVRERTTGVETRKKGLIGRKLGRKKIGLLKGK